MLTPVCRCVDSSQHAPCAKDMFGWTRTKLKLFVFASSTRESYCGSHRQGQELYARASISHVGFNSWRLWHTISRQDTATWASFCRGCSRLPFAEGAAHRLPEAATVNGCLLAEMAAATTAGDQSPPGSDQPLAPKVAPFWTDEGIAALADREENTSIVLQEMTRMLTERAALETKVCWTFWVLLGASCPGIPA